MESGSWRAWDMADVSHPTGRTYVGEDMARGGHDVLPWRVGGRALGSGPWLRREVMT